ncbi:hypothetical protein EC973_001118 [Apophysomyces ossiformis]|uniref:F-box domain-containing protein n=1 Tax=Apophysomyces ossiformis TaxID=679940 RepID=A0A8H7BK30_9FUNG|nr:hypothetical protein EC973_001118 [Apophysomyces ossiformis]
MLLRLPPELLHCLLSLLGRSAIAQLCLTCHRGYELCLPVLYAHIELELRSHFQQFLNGLQQHLRLKNAVKLYTKKISLVGRQSNSHWLVADFRSLPIELPNVSTVIFHHFRTLSVETVTQLAAALPNVQNLVFRYCNLVSTDLATLQFKSAGSLTLFWTDFSEPAVSRLLAALPRLVQVDFGANHNRDSTANGLAVQALQNHCSHIQDLSISLQQVSEPTLCDAIAFYGSQLRRLSIRCDGPQTLTAVATHANSIECLIIRATTWPSQPPLATEAEEEEEASDNIVKGSMKGILLCCQRLEHLELASWMTDEIPSVVWRAIETVAQRRTDPQSIQAKKMIERRNASHQSQRDAANRPRGVRRISRIYEIHPPTSANGGLWSIRQRDERHRMEINLPRQTLALDIEELEEIRQLYKKNK